MLFDALVVGELNADLILNNLKQPPAMGKEVIARQMSLVMGSSSAIFACNLSSMGAKVAFVGKLGDDMLARLILDSLTERQVDTRYVAQSKDWQTGITVATCEGNDRAMVTYAGAMELLGEEDVGDEILRSARHLHVSSVFLQTRLKPGIVRLFGRAKRLGLTTSLDPQFDPSEEWSLDLPELLPLVDVFLPNRSELRGFSGENDLLTGIDKLKSFANTLVVKDGEHGAWLQSGEVLLFQDAFLNKNVVDVIGAGDSFDAGFIFRFLTKEKPSECLRFAAAMGALNTTGAGGIESFSGGMPGIRQRLQSRLGVEI